MARRQPRYIDCGLILGDVNARWAESRPRIRGQVDAEVGAEGSGWAAQVEVDV